MAKQRGRRVATDNAKRTSAPRYRGWLLAITGICLAVAWIAWFARPAGHTAVTLPANLDDYQPDLRRLINAQVEQIKAQPKDATRHGELGLIYEANGIWPAARRAYATAVELDSSEPLWRLHLAIASHKAGDFPSSLEMLRSLVTDAPQLPQAQQRLGYAMLETGDLIAAKMAFERVIQLAPEAAEGYTSLADVLLRQDDVDGAVALLKKAISLDKKYAVAHFLLGTAYRRQERWELASRELKLGQRAAVRYLSDELTDRAEQYAVTVRARHQRGLRHMAAGEYAEAVNALQAALNADPENVAIMNLLAGAYVRTNRRGDAYELLQRAKRLNQSHYGTYANLATWHLSAGQLDEALSHAEQAIEIADWMVMAHLIRIQTLLQLKRIDDARDATSQALELFPKHPSLMRFSAQLNRSASPTPPGQS